MNLKPLFTFFISAFLTQLLSAQTYPPAVGQVGSTAMHKDSSAFINWASVCEVIRGLQDISTPALGSATVGDETMATGKAQTNAVLSLGDGGIATCTFLKPIANGPGADFAVFENGFDDLFLELAFVEVSSDGVNFVRFPAHSLTSTANQTSSFGSTNATDINNLAGKYRGGYGTPFDLQELIAAPNLNVNVVTHVRIIDVVGSINDLYATKDSYGNKINDPWPTAFPSGGFDLDAIGVIHENTTSSIQENSLAESIQIFPNPVKQGDVIQLNSMKTVLGFELFDYSGACLMSDTGSEVSTSVLPTGIYLIKLSFESSVIIKRIVIE